MNERKMHVLAMSVVLVTLLSGSVVQAQMKLSAIKIGYLNPKDADGGLLLGTDFAVPIDETVQLGISTNFFYKNYKKISTIAVGEETGGIQESTRQQQLEYSSIALPLYGMINIVIPSTRYFGYQIHGGLGYEFLFNKENNYVDDKSERRFYHGISWEASVGFHYIIGSRSAVTGEILYHSAKVSRNKDKTVNGLPTWSEVNLSGLGFRFGIRFDLM